MNVLSPALSMSTIVYMRYFFFNYFVYKRHFLLIFFWILLTNLLTIIFSVRVCLLLPRAMLNVRPDHRREW